MPQIIYIFLVSIFLNFNSRIFFVIFVKSFFSWFFENGYVKTYADKIDFNKFDYQLSRLLAIYKSYKKFILSNFSTYNSPKL